MPRGVKVPGITLGRVCRVCGSDEWKQRGASHLCLTCDRRTSLERASRLRSDPAVRMYHSSKRRAEAAGVAFTISVDDIREVWPRDGRCPALGIPMTFGPGVTHDASPTLDRLNPEWGYEKGNIAVLSLAANRAKGGLRAEDLERIATWMRGKGLA